MKTVAHDETDPTLAYRRSCRKGVCGSWAMNIDGIVALPYPTPTDSLKKGTSRITLLPHHHKLHADLPQEAQSGACDFQYQEGDGGAGLKSPKRVVGRCRLTILEE
jgi:2Fe-2S iron-sulfur cluster binding domain